MKASDPHDHPAARRRSWTSALCAALMRPLAAALACGVVATMTGWPPVAAQTGRADCVTFGKPKPSVGYTYERQEANGRVSEYTHHWEELTATGSRLRTVRG